MLLSSKLLPAKVIVFFFRNYVGAKSHFFAFRPIGDFPTKILSHIKKREIKIKRFN